MSHKRKKKSPVASKKDHTKLRENSKKVLARIVKKRWIVGFKFTRKHGSFDSHGIDLNIYFSPEGNGSRGSVGIQEKTNKPRRMKEHLKKYPCIPCYLLFTDDTTKELEYTYLLLILKCNAFNRGREQKIKARLRELECLLGGGQEHRVACGTGFI